MLFLIRHGESEANKGRPTCHPKCGGLTSQGYRQASCIAEYLKYYPLDLIVTSPYKRARQTAKPTSLVFHNTLKRVIVEEEWAVQEFTYLSPERLACSTTEDRKPEVERYWKEVSPGYIDGSGAESFETFVKRVRAFLDCLKSAEEKYETIVVFSHEQYINAVLWLLDCNPVEISPETMRQFRMYLDVNHIPNGAIVQLKFCYHENGWRHELITEHLKRLVLESEPTQVDSDGDVTSCLCPEAKEPMLARSR